MYPSCERTQAGLESVPWFYLKIMWQEDAANKLCVLRDKDRVITITLRTSNRAAIRKPETSLAKMWKRGTLLTIYRGIALMITSQLFEIRARQNLSIGSSQTGSIRNGAPAKNTSSAKKILIGKKKL